MDIKLISDEEMLRQFNKANEIKNIKEHCNFVVVTGISENPLYFNEKEGSLLLQAKKPYICIVLKNIDFEEGRGPMTFHKAFSDLETAVKYVLQQEGIYGSEQGINNYSGVGFKGSVYCSSFFNGYEIKIAELY